MCVHGLDGIHIILDVRHFQNNKLVKRRENRLCSISTF
jgi:hypothetical protein